MYGPRDFRRKKLAAETNQVLGSGGPQALLDGSSVFVPLTHTAVPTRAATGTTATFTRATTKTWQNNDGYLVTGLAGEIGFPGARRVDNLIRLGAAQSSTLAVAANVTMTLPAGAYQFSMGAGTGTATFSGTGGATGTLAASASARTFVAKTISAGTLIVTASVATLVDIQVVSMVAETDQTTPREYVSVGVPSDWAGTELVTNGTFDTATTGWTAYNLTGSVATISTDSGRLRVANNAATGRGAAYQMVPTIVGAKYVISCLGYSGNSGAGQWGLRVGTSPGDFSLTAVSGADGVPLSAEFTATSTTTYLTPNNIVATANLYVEFDNISVKPAYYHGSFVDGVKCFATDINGVPIPSTTLLGYSAEGARTNLCLQSQTIATAPWQIGNGIAVTADQYVAPDGTTTVDKLTALAGNTQHFWYQQVTTTAAVHTYSVYLRYVNNQWARIGVYDGVGSFYAAFDILNGVVGSTVGAVTATTIEPVGDGVTWRVSLTGTFAASALSQIYLSVVNADDPSFDLWNAVGTEAIGAWGAQLELGSFASSPIATTTAAVKRNADVLTYSSAGNIDGTKGWCYAEFDVANDSDGNQNIILGSDVAGVFPLYAQPSLGNVRTLDGTNAPIAQSAPMTGIRKGAGTWGGSTLQNAHNGVISSTTAFDGNMNVTAVIRVGEDNAGNSHFYGTIRNVRIGQRQLSASELQAITA